MLVYFTASIAGKKKFLPFYTKIIEYLKARHHEVISDHIIESSEQALQDEERNERLKFHEKLEHWINTCDFVIAEASYPSISVGYEISLALHRGKPLLLLYAGDQPPTLLAHHKNENLVCEHYTPETLPQIIDEFIHYVEGAEDTRFTFFITTAIAAYLEDVSRKEKTPKSVYLRKLIEADMRRKIS